MVQFVIAKHGGQPQPEDGCIDGWGQVSPSLTGGSRQQRSESEMPAGEALIAHEGI